MKNDGQRIPKWVQNFHVIKLSILNKYANIYIQNSRPHISCNYKKISVEFESPSFLIVDGRSDRRTWLNLHIIIILL